jgi:hypothetical protein
MSHPPLSSLYWPRHTKDTVVLLNWRIGRELLRDVTINSDKPRESDNLDGKLLKIIADHIATPICHIFNLSLLESVHPQAWREAKVIPLLKNSKAPFTAQTADQSACYQQ